jgi:hypothetical protein
VNKQAQKIDADIMSISSVVAVIKPPRDKVRHRVRCMDCHIVHSDGAFQSVTLTTPSDLLFEMVVLNSL